MDRVDRLLRSLWRGAGSTRLGLILLAALLLGSLLASLLPEMPADPPAQEPWLAAAELRFGPATALFRSLGLFDAFHTIWFRVLLAALLLNTLACTIQRLPRLRRALTTPPTVVRPANFYLGFAHRAEWPVASPAAAQAEVRQGLARRRYRVYAEQSEEAAHLYAERGRWSHAGTLLSHVAALLLIVAVAARPLLGWQESGVILLPGQVHPVGHGYDFAVQAGDLAVEYHPDGQPRGYRVPLTALAGDAPLQTHTVRANSPFSFRGVAFHLQGYGPAARVETPARTVDLAFAGGQVQEAALPETGLTLRVAYQSAEEGLFVEALDAGGALLGSGVVADGQQIEVAGTPVTLALGHYTVWQVSHDPTFGLAQGAGGLLLLGAVVSLWMPYRRLWLRIDAARVQMVGAGEFGDAFGALVEAWSAVPPAQSEGEAGA
jgi:cytochrome c biogenesis protein ResB